MKHSASAYKPKLRCAIYTRKSHEEGLEQEFNSLEAQREVCEKFVQSQRGEGWVLIPDHYDDGGFTGGNTERPALKRLLKDIGDGLIDVVVVYKIDRLSRSLLDFLQMVRMFDNNNVSFVSITQQINTSTPAGRLMINVLMSFAEYEREVTGERIRDKIAASKQKGLWMGGVVPLGYERKDKKLLIVESEAEIVRFIFNEYIQHCSIKTIRDMLIARGIKCKKSPMQEGKKHEPTFLTKTNIHYILHNPLYIGKIKHKEMLYDGEQEAIISMEKWEKVRALFKRDNRKRVSTGGKIPYPLIGLLYDEEGWAMTPSSSKNRYGKLYRYYVCTRAIKEDYNAVKLASIPATQIEQLVIAQVREMISAPEMVFKTYQCARQQAIGIDIEDIRSSLQQFNRIWEELFPIEQKRLLNLLIQRIVVTENGANIFYHANGLIKLHSEMKSLGAVA